MSSPLHDPKTLYRRLDSLFGKLDPTLPSAASLTRFIEGVHAELRGHLGIAGIVLLAEREGQFRVLRSIGADGARPGEERDPDGTLFQLLSRHHVYIFADAEESGSPAREKLLPPGPSAGVLIGERPDSYAVVFSLTDGWERETLDFALNTVRAALGARLTEQRLRGSVEEAAAIQRSLLPDEPPVFPGYEIACRALPAEEVGGDFFDFTVFDGEFLGLAIGDASGHGLPAALLVRDVVTGLRMGIEGELKTRHVFSKLNRVIHRSALSTLFASVFYAELEPGGNILYVNAGHPPPLLFAADSVQELAVGGTLVGPFPDSRYKRGFAHLEPGAVLVLYTDGIIERSNRAGDHFGETRLQQIVRGGLRVTATEILSRVFDEAIAFGDWKRWEDDATVVIVKRMNDVGRRATR